MAKTRRELFEAGFETRLDYLRNLWDEGDRLGALKVANGFPRLGDAREAIQKGWAAHTNPRLYEQMGQDPEELVEEGFRALAERYDLADAPGGSS